MSLMNTWWSTITIVVVVLTIKGSWSEANTECINNSTVKCNSFESCLNCSEIVSSFGDIDCSGSYSCYNTYSIGSNNNSSDIRCMYILLSSSNSLSVTMYSEKQ